MTSSSREIPRVDLLMETREKIQRVDFQIGTREETREQTREETTMVSCLLSPLVAVSKMLGRLSARRCPRSSRLSM